MPARKIGPTRHRVQAAPPGQLVNFNLEDADLPSSCDAISNITGKRFIFGGKVRQIKATVYSPRR